MNKTIFTILAISGVCILFLGLLQRRAAPQLRYINKNTKEGMRTASLKLTPIIKDELQRKP